MSRLPARPLETLVEDWSRLELQSDLPASATFHRAVSSLPPDTHDLPALPDGAAGLEELELLGEGGMGVVHAARDRVLGRVVAVKRARAEAGARATSALMAEARTLAALDHPNVIPVHALAKDATGAPVVVMKRVIGRRWSQVVHDGPDLDRDLRLALQVASALRYAHARGVLHRDVKLDNVMIGDFGEVYLMDWGCAVPLPDAVTTEIVGTPTHMAPEMVQVGASIGPFTDVFLLGATLHHALVGRPRHDAPRVRDVLDQAWRAEAPAWPPHVPAEVRALIDRACHREADARFATVEAFADAIRDALDHRHAVRLCHAAEDALRRLEEAVGGDGGAADVLFAETRVGFRAALDAWAGCAEAEAGLLRAFDVWVPWKLSQGDASAVEAFLAEQDPAFAARWRGAVAAVRDRRAQIEAEWRGGSLEVATGERYTFGAGLLAMCLAVFLVVQSTAAQAPMTSAQVAGFGWIGVVLPLLAVVLFRDRIRSHRMSMALASAIIAMGLGSALHRGAAWYAGFPADHILLGDCFVFGTNCVIIGLMIDTTLMWTGLPYLLAGFAIALWPGHGDMLYPVSAIISISMLVWLFRRRARRGQAGPAVG